MSQVNRKGRKSPSPRMDGQEDLTKYPDKKSLSSKTAETAMTSSNGSGANNPMAGRVDADRLPVEASIQEEAEGSYDLEAFPEDDIVKDITTRRNRSATPGDRQRMIDHAISEPRSGRKFRSKSNAPDRDYYDHIEALTPSGTRRHYSARTDPRESARKSSAYRDRQQRYTADDYHHGHDFHHSSDYLYSAERNRHERDFSDYLRSRRTNNESMYRLNSENDDLKQENYKMSKQIDSLKQKISDLKFTSSVMNKSDDLEQNMSERVQKVLASLHRKNDKLEKENAKMKEAIRALRRTTDRQEETIGFYRRKEQDFDLDFKEKDDIILLLEREKDEMRHYLLESQIENKVVNKKCEILRNKVMELEQALTAKPKIQKETALDRIIVVDSNNGDVEADAISSLGD